MGIYAQPEITNNFGVILGIGIVQEANRAEITLPMFSDDAALGSIDLCADAVGAFVADPLPDLLACLSSDVYVSYVQAEGMIDGMIPFRQDFSSTAYPGLLAPDPLPPTCGGLMIFYAVHADLPAGGRMRSGKNTVIGAATGDFLDGSFSSAYMTLLQTFADDLGLGYATLDDASKKWYRGVSAPKGRVPGTVIIRSARGEVRGYVGTQRRRQLPH